MKTSVCQSLIDKGDPLALAMVADGASVFKLVPVKDWKYFIFKIVYARDEDMERVIKTGYMIGTENHIEGDAYIYCPEDCWYTWEMVQSVPGSSYKHCTLHKLLDELKRDYNIGE